MGEGVKPGESFMTLVHPSNSAENKMRAPEGVEAGQAQDAPAMQPYEVVAPEGSKPGDVITFALPDSRPKTTQIPEGVAAGQTFTVMIPAPHPFPVPVPTDKGPGDEISFVGPDGRERKAVVPEG